MKRVPLLFSLPAERSERPRDAAEVIRRQADEERQARLTETAARARAEARCRELEVLLVAEQHARLEAVREAAVARAQGEAALQGEVELVRAQAEHQRLIADARARASVRRRSFVLLVVAAGATLLFLGSVGLQVFHFLPQQARQAELQREALTEAEKGVAQTRALLEAERVRRRTYDRARHRLEAELKRLRADLAAAREAPN